MAEQDIKVFNPNKEISIEITLQILIRHRDAMTQARTGEIFENTLDKIKDNQRKFNQVRALNLIISIQKDMIGISRPIINFRSMQKWRTKYKKTEERDANLFEDFECDYSKLLGFRETLKFFENEIIEADKTKRIDDDFILEKINEDGKYYELTKNFYDMLEELEDSYEQIYLLMLINKIVSAGIEEDEELTYKEKETEMVRRIEDA